MRDPDEPSEFSFTAQTFKYWELFLSWLFRYPSRCFELKANENPQILENPSVEFCQFAQSYRMRSASKGIICQVTPDKEAIDKTCHVLEAVYESISCPEMCELVTAEVLAKVLAYRELSEGLEIGIPTLNAEGIIELVPYQVDRVFDLWSKVRAFGLVSLNTDCGAPILLFRGTEFSVVSEGGRASIISDLDPKGPGRSLFEKAEPDLHGWMKKAGKKARIFGHSLGGVILAYTLIQEHELISQLPYETSYAFNFPGISDDLLQKWEEIEESHRPAFKGLICRGDIVSKFGKLFGDVYEVSYKKPLSPVRAHEQLLFSQPICYLQQVDLSEENVSSSRSFYSKLHQQTSSMIYEFGLKFLFPS